MESYRTIGQTVTKEKVLRRGVFVCVCGGDGVLRAPQHLTAPGVYDDRCTCWREFPRVADGNFL